MKSLEVVPPDHVQSMCKCQWTQCASRQQANIVHGSLPPGFDLNSITNRRHGSPQQASHFEWPHRAEKDVRVIRVRFAERGWCKGKRDPGSRVDEGDATSIPPRRTTGSKWRPSGTWENSTETSVVNVELKYVVGPGADTVNSATSTHPAL